MLCNLKDIKRTALSVVSALLLATASVGDLLASESNSNMIEVPNNPSPLGNSPGLPPWPKLLGLGN